MQAAQEQLPSNVLTLIEWAVDDLNECNRRIWRNWRFCGEHHADLEAARLAPKMARNRAKLAIIRTMAESLGLRDVVEAAIAEIADNYADCLI